MNLKEEIKNLLLKTKREGMEKLIESMSDSGFFDAPASTKFHGATNGALAEHSINVYKVMMDLAEKLLGKEYVEKNYDSIIICSLLHDLGKAGQFGKPYYIDNILKSGNVSDSQPFKTNSDLKSLPHEIASVIEISRYIELTEDEQRAIAWHNGLYGAFKYDIQGKEDELYLLLHFADMWCSRVVEKGR